MATTTGSIVFYDPAIVNISGGGIDLSDGTADAFGVLLMDSTYSPDVTGEFVSPEIKTPDTEISGSGYARDSLTTLSWTQSSGTATFNADDAVFTASGGDITARYWALYYDNSEADTALELVAYGLLDITAGGTDVTATDGNTLTVQWNGSGIFTGSFTDA